jgi:hypothetical protein
LQLLPPRAVEKPEILFQGEGLSHEKRYSSCLENAENELGDQGLDTGGRISIIIVSGKVA